MDTVFIADVIKAVAWPLVTLVVAIMLRKPFTSLIDAVRQIKYGGVEAQFERGTENLQRDLAKSAVHEAAMGAGVATGEKSPLMTVTAAWRDVEQAIRAGAHLRLGIEDGTISPAKLLERLVEKGALQPSTGDAARTLLHLRNLAESAQSEHNLAERVPSFVTMARAVGWAIHLDLTRTKSS
jgi:hypothetical protein